LSQYKECAASELKYNTKPLHHFILPGFLFTCLTQFFTSVLFTNFTMFSLASYTICYILPLAIVVQPPKLIIFPLGRGGGS